MAGPRLGDQPLEVLQLGGGGRDLVSNNETRSAGNVEQLAKLRILVQIAVDRRIFHVCLQTIDIEADYSGDFEHLGLVELPARLIKRVMEDSVFALLVGREGLPWRQIQNRGQELETLCRQCAASGRLPGLVP